MQPVRKVGVTRAAVGVVDVRTLAAVADDGRVWRAFGHLIVRGGGWVLLLPVRLVCGDLTGVVDRCPVPWPEVWAVIDTPLAPDAPVLQPEELARLAPQAAVALAPYGWVRDVVTAGEAVPTLTRLVGPSGERLACVAG